VGRDPERLADREDRHRDDDDIDAVGQLRDAEGEPLLPGLRVQPDDADRQAEGEGGEPTDARCAEDGGDRDEREHHDRQVVGCAEADGEPDDERRDEDEQRGADGAGDERADRRRRQGLSGPALPRHLVALDGRDHGGGLPGCVEQDRGRRSAVHAAVVDAGEHDERARRAQPVGERQQERHRHRRADAGKHPHGGPQDHADDGVEEVDRRDRGCEAAKQLSERLHYRIPSRTPAGRGIPSPSANR
jgi:hypothetical protein